MEELPGKELEAGAEFLLSIFGGKGEDRRKTQNWVCGMKSGPV